MNWLKRMTPEEAERAKISQQRFNKYAVPITIVGLVLGLYWSLWINITKEPTNCKNSEISDVYDISKGATVGVPYTYDFSRLTSFLDTESSEQDYSFYIGSMTAPPVGLILGPGGILKGTPTGESSVFEVCVEDSEERSVCREFNLDVNSEITTKKKVSVSTPTSKTNVISATGFSGKWEGTAIEKMNGRVGTFPPGCTMEMLQQFNFTRNGNELRGTVSFTSMRVTSCGPLDPSMTAQIGIKNTMPIIGTIDGTSAKFSSTDGRDADYTATFSGNTLNLKMVECHSPDPRCTGTVDSGYSGEGIPDTLAYETINWWSSEFSATKTK